MTFRPVTVAALAFSILFTGCLHKPDQAKSRRLPQTDTATAAGKTDSADIFNEFYKDTKSTPGTEKKEVKTFSMNTPEAYVPQYSKNGRFVVQVATIPSRTLADELATEFQEKGYPAYTAEVQNPTPDLQGTYYRVRIGKFASLADAKNFGENLLRPANYDYWVDLTVNDGSRPSENQSQNNGTPATSTYQTPAIPASGEGTTGSGWRDTSSGW